MREENLNPPKCDVVLFGMIFYDTLLSLSNLLIHTHFKALFIDSNSNIFRPPFLLSPIIVTLIL